MASHQVVGTAECPIREVVSVLKSSQVFSQFGEKWSAIARDLGLSSELIWRVRMNSLLGMISLTDVVYEIIESWVAMEGSSATLHRFVQVLEQNGIGQCGESLRLKFSQPSNEADENSIVSMDAPETVTVGRISFRTSDHIGRGCRLHPPHQQQQPLFWTEEKVYNFLEGVSDWFEGRRWKGAVYSRYMIRLEANPAAVVNGNWLDEICPGVRGWLELRASKDRIKYNGFMVRDLLRAVKETKLHWSEMGQEVQAGFGDEEVESIVMYWLSRFPKLLPHTWEKMRDAPGLQSYF